MKPIDSQFVKDTLLELDPSLSEVHDTALVILSALACGPDAAHLAEFTGLPLEFVANVCRRMIQAELWTDLEACDHWYLSGGVICTTLFQLDVLVAQGLVVRQWEEEEGQYRYYYEAYAPRREGLKPAVN